MPQLSRRAFVQGLAAMPLALGVAPLARAGSALVRYDCTSPMGLEMLGVFANAVAQMRSIGPDNPMSWMWQWYAHFVNGATTKSAELDRIFGSGKSTMRSLAEDTWSMCQPHGGQNANFFLPWHRMFVYYFERVVRYVSGRPDFTLPYWDYTSPDPAKRGILPPQFRMPGDPLFGNLYIANRKALANAGEPIHKDQPTDVMDISDTMAKASYSTSGGVTGFCRAVDSGIHSRIHVLVGTATNMGKIPYAGYDPLFWVHHANIDRIWSSWTRNGGINPVTASWAKKKFVMADAGGQRVQAPLNKYFSEADLGYDYETLVPSPAAAAQALIARTTTTGGTERVARARNAATLGAAPTRVLLEPMAGVRDPRVLGLDERQPAKRTYLLLKDLHAWVQPDVLFHVYLGPRGATRLDRAHYAGNINFFDAEFHDFGDPTMDMALGENLYSFDVTGILQALRRSGSVGARDALAVTIVPAGRPAGGRPMVGSIELIRQ